VDSRDWVGLGVDGLLVGLDVAEKCFGWYQAVVGNVLGGATRLGWWLA